MNKLYLTLDKYDREGGTLHIKAYGRDIAEYYVSRQALLDFADKVRREDIMLKTQ